MSRDPLLQAMPHLSLALLLLNEYFDPQSFWKPYIGILKMLLCKYCYEWVVQLDVLPTEYSTPLYFSKEDFQLLNGSPTQSK